VYDLLANAYVRKRAPYQRKPKSGCPREGAERREQKPRYTESETPYGKLLEALERLTALLKRAKGHSNRELKSITSELNAISDYLERE
jgi:hypothetical protein